MMKYVFRIFRWFFGLCEHEYEILSHKEGDQFWGESRCGYYYLDIYKCKKCGKYKKIHFSTSGL